MFIGQVAMKFSQDQPQQKKQDDDGGIIEKPPTLEKSSNQEEFVKTPEAKAFIDKWSSKVHTGKTQTKRGLTAFLQLAYSSPRFKSDKDILMEAEKIMKMLHNMDNFFSAFGGLKAKSEGLVKGIKSVAGGIKGVLGMK